jgi:hypothetical protein
MLSTQNINWSSLLSGVLGAVQPAINTGSNTSTNTNTNTNTSPKPTAAKNNTWLYVGIALIAIILIAAIWWAVKK